MDKITFRKELDTQKLVDEILNTTQLATIVSIVGNLGEVYLVDGEFTDEQKATIQDIIARI